MTVSTYARPKLKGDLSDLMGEFDKALGGNDESATVTDFIDTGFWPLNYALTGNYELGLPQGRLIEMFGASSTGKTALATEWMAAAQRMGGVAAFRDWERSFSQLVASEGFGLDLTAPYWSYKKPRTWEEGNMQALAYAQWVRDKGIIHEKAPILIVLDSIASAVPASSAGKNMDELTMNDTTALARVTSTTLKSMAIAAEDYNATFMYLNQIRTKPGVVYGDPRTTPGGSAMEFYSTCRLALGRQKVMKQVEGQKEFVGQNIDIQCVKSKLTKPFKECTLRMSFSEAGIAFFDKEVSTIEVLAKMGKIPVPSKGFVEWEGKRISPTVLAQRVRDEKLMPLLNKMFLD
jgi:recombination protein RecA